MLLIIINDGWGNNTLYDLRILQSPPPHLGGIKGKLKKLSNREPVRRAPERAHITSLMLTLYRRISLTGTSETILFIWKNWAIVSKNYLSLDHNSRGRGLSYLGMNIPNDFLAVPVNSKLEHLSGGL